MTEKDAATMPTYGHGRRSLLAAGLTLPALARAQALWPTRPLRVIAPYAAGGPSDILARALAPGWQAALGQPVVVENRPGAGAMLGTEVVARATDGHTVLLADSPHTIIPAVQERVPYDAAADFRPVTLIGFLTSVLVVHHANPARDVAGLVAAARTGSDAVSFGSSGIGSLTHLLPEWFGLLAGVRFANVPYRGAAPALQDVAAGQVTAIFSSLLAADALLRAGEVRALGAAAAERLPLAPAVPTFREQGYDLVAGNWYGVLAPAAMPTEQVERLSEITNTLLAEPATRARLAALGLEPRPPGPEPFAALLRADFARWAEVARAAGVRVR